MRDRIEPTEAADVPHFNLWGIDGVNIRTEANMLDLTLIADEVGSPRYVLHLGRAEAVDLAAYIQRAATLLDGEE